MPKSRKEPTTMVVWANPERPSPLMPGDVSAGIRWFRERVGKDAKLVTLNPQNANLAAEVRDGIEVSYCPGCLSWECWLGTSNNFAPPSPAHAGGSILEQSAEDALGEAQSAQKSSRGTFSKLSNSKHHAPRPRGRPRKKISMAQILEVQGGHRRGRPQKTPAAEVRRMRAGGMDVKQIARSLGVSAASIYRHLGPNQKRSKNRG
jgi:hypothetical protein